ncbi:helix-turn-helix transcriptional regulator [Lipingzhangella sp. LS1_29]|uniref:Helix-turn-helix transcriptional regulator n=1 Tax=Lipingzhangella rawalii TaxID=2055835 RepID=A0ABU2H092_9ACTN|nr:helix-turn-helix transcriptional regulator [Lipingzhangella rawalii]MDS1268716.1 helix-turn-helix transcriptional regulator [Lipingzhangella rawalii]
MAAKSRVTLRAQWLGEMLRGLREENQLTLAEAGEYIRRSKSTMSRFEAGTWPISQDEVADLMKLYGVDSPTQREQMVKLAAEITETGWWERYYQGTAMINYVWLENRAEQLRIFTPLVVHGLFQTREYAERLIQIGDPDASAKQIERWVGVRMARQEILERKTPPTVQLILDEAVLRRPVGGTDVMRAQLRRLLSEAEKPSIQIQVLPFGFGEYPGTDGQFTLIKMGDPFPQVVYIDSPAGQIFLESSDVQEFATQYDRIQGCCLSAEDSVAFIAAIEKDLS